MKKQAISTLLIITGIFLAFTMGLFVGRNYSQQNIYISKLPSEPMYAQEAPESLATESDVPEETIQFPLNINTATQEEFTALPGIGETLAKRILDYRKSHGEFSVPEELLNVPGIGTGKLEAILDLITTGG